MTRMVFCRKFQKEMEGLAKPPFPGERGQKLFEEVSKEAWTQWLQHQTMLINEKHLSVVAPETQTYLAEQLEKYLNNEPFDRADGYVPPKDQ